ncbi:hypothetical protein [Liquorilactobacillus ghanensis]
MVEICREYYLLTVGAKIELIYYLELSLTGTRLLKSNRFGCS